MTRIKNKPKKCGICDDCHFKIYKDDYIVSCAHFVADVSYHKVVSGGGCRAFYERLAKLKVYNPFKGLFSWLFRH